MIKQLRRELDWADAQGIAVPRGHELRNLLNYIEAAEYGFKVRGEWECKHSYPGPDNVCAACGIQQARHRLELDVMEPEDADPKK